MKPEKRELIDDLFAAENRREATLFAGGKILRRRQQGRAAQRIFVLAALTLVMAWLAGQWTHHAIPAQNVVSAKPAVGLPMRSLTDDELLALFPHTPVSLITLSNGKKLLYFPRPGDQARLVGRL